MFQKKKTEHGGVRSDTLHVLHKVDIVIWYVYREKKGGGTKATKVCMGKGAMWWAGPLLLFTALHEMRASLSSPPASDPAAKSTARRDGGRRTVLCYTPQRPRLPETSNCY
jgi:hypothetical protein